MKSLFEIVNLEKENEICPRCNHRMDEHGKVRIYYVYLKEHRIRYFCKRENCKCEYEVKDGW